MAPSAGENIHGAQKMDLYLKCLNNYGILEIHVSQVNCIHFGWKLA